jgi:hypothetical protein
MTDARELTKQLYDLQIQLWEYQGDEIEALQRANHALQKSHETIGQMLKLMGEWMRVSSSLTPGCDCDQENQPDPSCHASDCVWRRRVEAKPETA